MVLNAKFWSLPVHTYQKQSFLIIFLAVRGWGKNLVIDKDSIVKKWNFEILTKTHVMNRKRKLITCIIQIQVSYDLILKNGKIQFWKKKIKGTLWSRNSRKKNFCFSKFQFFFWKMASMRLGKCWKKQSHEIWAHFEHPPRNHERSSTRGGSANPLPCRIGLTLSPLMD